MAPSSTLFDATTQDIENLLAAQAHMGSKNLQVSVFYIGWDIGTDADGTPGRFTWTLMCGRPGPMVSTLSILGRPG